MLRHKSFPPNDGDQYYALALAGSTLTHVTEQAVKGAFFSQAVRQAPGSDKPSVGPIRLLWEWDKERLVRLTRAAIHTVEHPVVWKRASGVVIHKPGNNDYTKLKTYHSTSLLSGMGKVVQEVAT
jgi:hypothetical protein